MKLLDEISGYEFEDATASLFRALGYEDVAVATYDNPGPKRGAVVTGGRFTVPAEEYEAMPWYGKAVGNLRSVAGIAVGAVLLVLLLVAVLG